MNGPSTVWGDPPRRNGIFRPHVQNGAVRVRSGCTQKRAANSTGGGETPQAVVGHGGSVVRVRFAVRSGTMYTTTAGM